jgi:hypothetical protein
MPTDDKATNKFKGPTYHYGPNGEAEIFHHSDHVPKGWTPHPKAADEAQDGDEKQPDPKTGDGAAALPMKKKDIVAALSEGGIDFNSRASAGDLYTLLLENLRKVLTEAEIAFAPEADAPALLELLPKPE